MSDDHDCRDFAVWNEYSNPTTDPHSEEDTEGVIPRWLTLEGTCRKCGEDLLAMYMLEGVGEKTDPEPPEP